MHACMIHMLTTRLAPHDCLMCSQAAARQWSLHTMDMNGYTSRGPLHSMVVHAVVQWLPSLCCMCRPRTIARSTSLSACSACVVRGRYLRLSRASRGFRESSSASETNSGCTIADQVAEGRSCITLYLSPYAASSVRVCRYRAADIVTCRVRTRSVRHFNDFSRDFRPMSAGTTLLGCPPSTETHPLSLKKSNYLIP